MDKRPSRLNRPPPMDGREKYFRAPRDRTCAFPFFRLRRRFPALGGGNLWSGRQKTVTSASSLRKKFPNRRGGGNPPAFPHEAKPEIYRRPSPDPASASPAKNPGTLHAKPFRFKNHRGGQYRVCAFDRKTEISLHAWRRPRGGDRFGPAGFPASRPHPGAAKPAPCVTGGMSTAQRGSFPAQTRRAVPSSGEMA